MTKTSVEFWTRHTGLEVLLVVVKSDTWLKIEACAN